MQPSDIEFALNNYDNVLTQYGEGYMSVHNGECKVYTNVTEEVYNDTFASLCKNYGFGNFVFLAVTKDHSDARILAEFLCFRFMKQGV